MPRLTGDVDHNHKKAVYHDHSPYGSGASRQTRRVNALIATGLRRGDPL
jgi:hypothetical protein